MTTTAPATSSELQDAGYVDVLIVGAGVSGIGAAHELRERFPDRTFVILDAQDNRGGTWWTHRYPGVRSDSDLFTYGYRFKPWRGPSIAAGDAILAYLDEVIEEDGLGEYIRYRHRVTSASWSTGDRRWTVEVTREDTGERLRFSTSFLWMCQGYYNHAKPYQPELDGLDRFQGTLVHPQGWPADLDLTGKRVVVIGSGATAATLIPAIAKQAGFTEQSFNACLANQQVLDGIESVRMRAVDKFKVQSTPTFFINGTSYPGALTIEDMAKAIDPYLKG